MVANQITNNVILVNIKNMQDVVLVIKLYAVTMINIQSHYRYTGEKIP